MIRFQDSTQCRHCRNTAVKNNFCTACQRYEWKDKEIYELNQRQSSSEENIIILKVAFVCIIILFVVFLFIK